MARYDAPLYFAFRIISAWCLTAAAAGAAEFYSVVEPNGAVVLCLSKGALLFPDRCEGSGRLTIVQPIKEGVVVWRTAPGTVSLENETSNPDCALARAKWDPKTEQVVSTGRRIMSADPALLLERLDKSLFKEAKLVPSDVSAFALDLDNDGNEEIVFVASNLNRVSDDHEKDDKPYPYVIQAGVLPKDSKYPAIFYHDEGTYIGGTDAIGDAVIKGVVPISPGTGEIALLTKAGSGLSGDQSLIRYRHGSTQRIETFEFRCN